MRKVPISMNFKLNSIKSSGRYAIGILHLLHSNGNVVYFTIQGKITLIPKSDQDLSYLKNWRPITLLNVDYKILSSVLVTRLKSTLNDLIHEDQTGYIKGRHNHV